MRKIVIVVLSFIFSLPAFSQSVGAIVSGNVEDKTARSPIENQARVNMGTITLAPLASNMNEVVVTSKKFLLNTSIDRKVYNVSQDIMAQSGSASDVLKNVASVEVDIDEQEGCEDLLCRYKLSFRQDH